MAAGVNRFTWDLQYAPVTPFQGMVLWGATTNGPTALPGTYQARLNVDGRTLTQPITVKKHPMFNVSDADLGEQFELASRIRDKVNEANDAIIQIRRIKAQLAERVQKANSADVKAIAEQLAKEMSAVEEDVYQVRNQSNQDPLNFPIRLNNKLSALAGVVASANGAPTASSYAVYEDVAGRIDLELAKLEQILDTDLGAYNKLVREKAVPAVVLKKPAP